jgi:copper homeostasis protein
MSLRQKEPNVKSAPWRWTWEVAGGLLNLMSKVLLEIGVATLDDALAAQAGGADRLELNAALAVGGLTPSLGTLVAVKAAVQLPVMFMVRPRPAGFSYSASDFAVMQHDVDLALQNGADGIVLGILAPDGKIDVNRCRQMVRQANTRQVIFHRAFDVTPDPAAALEQLIDLGVRRVMTSGQELIAIDGAELIARLIDQARGRIEILPAGGVRAAQVAELRQRTGCTQIHAAPRKQWRDPSVLARPGISFGTLRIPEDSYEATDKEAITKLRRALDACPV